jgi:DNA-binding NarL/FixJ family response regulator
MIRVLLIDDEALLRVGLRMIIESDPELEVVGEAADGADAVDAVRSHRPDVVLMDVRMPRLDGVAATAAVRALDHPPAVIVLTTFDTDEYVFRALESGAAGFLLKDTPPQELVRAVTAVHRGDAMLAPSVARRVVAQIADGPRNQRQREAVSRLERLTPREREVLIEVGQGLSNAEIGDRLYLSEATVKSHVGHLFDKLGSTNRVQIALIAYRAGLSR